MSSMGSRSAGRESAAAKVDLSDLGVALNDLGRAIEHDLAPVQHGHLVGQAHHHAHVVLDQDDRHGAWDVGDQLRHALALGRSEPGRWLVEQQHARAAGHRERQLELAPLAIGERANDDVAPVCEADLVQLSERLLARVAQSVDGAVHHPLEPARAVHGERDVLEHGEPEEDVADLVGPADAETGSPVLGHPRDVGAEEQDAARRWPAGTRSEAPSTAWTPPNERDSATVSIAGVRAASPPTRAGSPSRAADPAGTAR